MRLDLGSATITAIVEQELGRMGALLSEATPEAVAAIEWLRPHYVDEQGDLQWVIQCFVVEVDGVTVVIDTCIGDGKSIPFPDFWNDLASGFLERFRDSGFDPADVDVVLCTHLHLDHVGWNTTKRADGRWVPTFPNARYLFERTEYEDWAAEAEQPGDGILADTQQHVQRESIRPIVDAGLAELVDAPYRVSPSLRLVPSNGHTPGHVCVELHSDDVTAVITGDAFHHPCQIARPQWATTADFDQDASTATRRQLLTEWADTDVTVIGTHFAPPSYGRVRTGVDGYVFQSG
jgi:glyoxylase-like metal-dependent hydrolase (beta-lactamase superfamily II)